jgi:hypothetical protein
MLFGMDWARARTAFRQERTQRAGSRVRLVERASESGGEPIDPSTVYRIETDTDYYPKLDTFARLVEAMGLTLTQFFASVEGVTPISGAKGTSRDAQRALDQEAVEIGADVGSQLQRAIDARVRAILHAEAQHESTRARRTKSGSNRRR